jgi:hypothetical protein
MDDRMIRDAKQCQIDSLLQVSIMDVVLHKDGFYKPHARGDANGQRRMLDLDGARRDEFDPSDGFAQ